MKLKKNLNHYPKNADTMKRLTMHETWIQMVDISMLGKDHLQSYKRHIRICKRY